jgi:hypothetical protein
MEDSENGGKGEIQERNRTVVYLPREKVEREILSFWWSSTSKTPAIVTTLRSAGTAALHARRRRVGEVAGVLAGVAVQRAVLEAAGLDEARGLHVAQPALLGCLTGIGSRGQQFSRFSIQVESLCFLFQMLRFRTTFVVQFVPRLLTTLLSSGNTPGMAYGAQSKIQNPWRRRRRLPEGV